MTMRYAHLLPGHLEDASSALGPIVGAESSLREAEKVPGSVKIIQDPVQGLVTSTERRMKNDEPDSPPKSDSMNNNN